MADSTNLFLGKVRLAGSPENIKKLRVFTETICSEYPDIDCDSLFEVMMKSSARYGNALADPPQTDQKEHFKSLFNVAFAAKNLLDELDKLDPIGRIQVAPKLGEDLGEMVKRWREVWEWLNQLSQQVSPLAQHMESIETKPGARGRTKEADLLLLRTIYDFLSDNLEASNRWTLTRKIALRIHTFVTDEVEPQKFRRLKLMVQAQGDCPE